MKTEKRDVYICEYCGSEYASEELCREHEERCHLKRVAVRVALQYTIDKFVFTVSMMKECQLLATQKYEEVYGYDENCDRFAIMSENTSEEHVKELKDKLIKKATEVAEKTREEWNQYYGELLKGLEEVNKKEEE